jgi:hypothetical protein
MDRINRKLVAFWGTDRHILGRKYDADAIETAWYDTIGAVFTAAGLIGSIAQTLV